MLRAGIDFYLAKPKAPPKVRSYPARYPRTDDVALPVHDGDTSWFERDICGSRTFALLKARYFNVFAPETVQTGGMDCRQFVIDWLAYQAKAATAWPFIIDAVLDGNGHEIETLGRTVVIVRNAAGTANLNEDMSAYIDAHGYPRGTGG